MAETNHHKLDIAASQLESAIGLFVSGGCRYSAITLAGAADTILSQLAANRGREPFLDYARRVFAAMEGGTPSRSKYGRHINDVLGVNDLKHLDPEDVEDVSLDAEKCAIGAITRAVGDYVIVTDERPHFVQAWWYWCWQNLDNDVLSEVYRNRPDVIE